MRMSCRTKLFQSPRYPARRGMHGASPIKTLLLIPVGLVLLLLLAVAFFEGRKAYWDYRVRQMCDKDGGIKVYEQVALPNDYLGKDGAITIRAKPFNPERPLNFEAKPTDPFYYEWLNEPIRTGSLAVGKHTFRVIRSSDGTVLGTMIIYSRSGGDFPTFAHPSSISCPDAKTRPDPLTLIFTRQTP